MMAPRKTSGNPFLDVKCVKKKRKLLKTEQKLAAVNKDWSQEKSVQQTINLVKQIHTHGEYISLNKSVNICKLPNGPLKKSTANPIKEENIIASRGNKTKFKGRSVIGDTDKKTMARKKPIKVEEQDEFDVDEPSEVDEGQNDGDSSSNEYSSGRRKSGRVRTVKKPYRGDGSTDEELDEEDEDDDLDDESDEERPVKKKVMSRGGRPSTTSRGGRGRGRGKIPAKKAKVEEPENEESDEIDGEESEGDTADTPPEFRSGCFVVLKHDILNKTENHPLWKIDGKSLLQKYDRMKKDDEVLYKSTTIYAGWSKTVLDTYYPIKVDYVKIEGQESLIKFDTNQLEDLIKDNKADDEADEEEKAEASEK